MHRNKLLILLSIIFLAGFCFLSPNAYADNSTEIVFEVPEPTDDSATEDTEGDDILVWEPSQDWIIDRSTKAYLTVFLPQESFTSISLDDKSLTEGQEFTLSGEYVTFSFKKSYLDSLPEGHHEIVIRFANIDEEEGEALFSTYIDIYTEESAEEAGIIVPNTGFFSAAGEIATQSLPVVIIIGLIAVGIFICFKLRNVFKKYATNIKRSFHLPEIHFTLFDRLSSFINNHKPSTRSAELIIFIFLALGVTGGLGTVFHHLSHKGDASSSINLTVNTTDNVSGAIQYYQSIARAVDTVTVETEPGVEYDIYVSAGNDNALRADGSENAFTENTNLISLSDGSWGFNTDPDSSIYSAVPKKGEEVLVAHGTEPGETKVYYAAKAGEDFATGLYKATVHYTIIAKTSNPVVITPDPDESSHRVTITTPFVKNGDMNIEIPSILIGNYGCSSPNLESETNHYITLTCTIPSDIAPGSYDVSIDFSDLEEILSLDNGYIQPEEPVEPDPEPDPTPDPEPDPNPDPEPDPGPAPEPEPDPEPEPSITYYTVTSSSSNSTYGSTNRSSTSVAAGTTFTSSGNTLTFSDGRTIVATAKKVTGYSTVCSGWNPASGTVNSNMSITATCTGAAISYSVTINVDNSSYGRADASEIWIPYNTTFTSNGNTLTFSNNRTVTVTPVTATGYNTTCSGWSPVSGTITGSTTITANCTRTAKSYTATFKVSNSSYGSIPFTSAPIPYGTTYSSSGGTLTFSNGTSITATPTSATGYTTTCKSWSPSSGTVKANTTFTVTCTRTAEKNTVTYLSNNGKDGTKSFTVETGKSHTIKPLADFAGTRYSNIYSRNSDTYKKWTKEGYYFDYWEGSDGKKYAPAGQDEGHNPYASCTTCLTSFSSDGSGLTLTAHFTKMNNINLAAITLAWPDGYTSDNKMVTASDSVSRKITIDSPDSKTVNRYALVPTAEFKTAAKNYYTNSNRRNSLEASSLASNKCDNYYDLGCSGSWYSSDKGYLYGRSCDRFASISVYYGIKGLGNTNIRMPFGLPAQSKYFARLDQGWKAVNTKDYSKTSSSTSGTATNAGRYEEHYQPGDIRLVYRTSSKHDSYKLKFNGNTYYLGHIAIYVKTEDGLSHIAEASHATYEKNSSSYKQGYIFAHTAYSHGGNYGHLSPFYYKTTAGGYDKNEWYAIWRYTGEGK